MRRPLPSPTCPPNSESLPWTTPTLGEFRGLSGPIPPTCGPGDPMVGSPNTPRSVLFPPGTRDGERSVRFNPFKSSGGQKSSQLTRKIPETETRHSNDSGRRARRADPTHNTLRVTRSSGTVREGNRTQDRRNCGPKQNHSRNKTLEWVATLNPPGHPTPMMEKRSGRGR